jgi:hypothetical protein
MRTGFPIERPAPRPPGRVGPWIEIAAWLLAFGILLAAPCAPEPPGRGGASAAQLRAASGGGAGEAHARR